MSYQPEQLSDMVNRPSRDVWVRPSNGQDLVDVIQSYSQERTIRIPKGLYTPTNPVSLNLAVGDVAEIIGSGKGTKIYPYYSLDPWFDISNTVYLTGPSIPRLILKNLYIYQSMQSATHTLLDLQYAHDLWMENVSVINSNATDRGIGIKLGPHEGMRHHLFNVFTGSFTKGLLSEADLITAIGCSFEDPPDGGACVEIADGKDLLFISTMLSGGAGACFGFDFGAAIDTNIRIMDTDWDTPPATATVFRNAAANHKPLIDGFDSRTAGLTISNDYTKFNWKALNDYALYKFKNVLTGTGNGAQQTIAHGLCGTPSKIYIFPTASGATECSITAAADATNIYVTVTNAKTYKVYVEL